ncbi:Spindle assembly protein, partial [Globisporangium splendens]
MESFDRDAPLFDRRLHVLVQYPDREEKLQPLTIRLLHGVRQNSATNQKERVFRVEITDDDGADPYFLYLWSVSEEEFHDLKQQQRLLVDFVTFPTNLIELLQCCLKDSVKKGASTTRQETTKPVAAGDEEDHTDDDGDAEALRGTGSSIDAEPNPLSRSQGPFFPGDDAVIKAYLAARLAHIGAEKQYLASTLKKTTSDLRKTQQSEAQLARQLETVTQQTESTISREKMKYADGLNAQRELAASTLKQREDEYELKIDTLMNKHEDEIKSLRQTVEANDAVIQDLTKLKYQHEMQIEQLQLQTKHLGTGKHALSEELHMLRIQNKELDQRTFQQEKQINQLEMRTSALQQQVLDKEDVITKTSDLLQAAQIHKQEVEESLKVYRDNHARLQQKLELSISEINKGNDIIERIQNESRALKTKMRMKAKIIKQQEQILDEKQAQRDELVRELKGAKEDIRKREEDIMALKWRFAGANTLFSHSTQDNVKELKQKLEDSNKLLASNQQVIAWLNKEINEAQIAHQRRATAHPSVLSFRPTDKSTVESARPPPTTQFTSTRNP